jgi:DNA-binding transcriptional regulator PaaX
MDKEELKLAINYSDLYSNSEKAILNELVRTSVDFISVNSAKSLKEHTGLSTTTTYTALNSLKKRGIIISNIHEPNSYTLNQKDLSRLIELYKTKV